MQTAIISAVYKFFKHINSHFNTGCVLFHLVFSAHFQHSAYKTIRQVHVVLQHLKSTAMMSKFSLTFFYLCLFTTLLLQPFVKTQPVGFEIRNYQWLDNGQQVFNLQSVNHESISTQHQQQQQQRYKRHFSMHCSANCSMQKNKGNCYRNCIGKPKHPRKKALTFGKK